jgi:hypothetical protein
MKAVVLHEYGGPEKLEFEDNVPDPPINGDTVLIAAVAASVNPIDWKMRSGARQRDFRLIITLVMNCKFIVHFSTSFSTTSGLYNSDWAPRCGYPGHAPMASGEAGTGPIRATQKRVTLKANASRTSVTRICTG